MISSYGSYILNNWNDMRSKFRYNLLYEIARISFEKHIKPCADNERVNGD